MVRTQRSAIALAVPPEKSYFFIKPLLGHIVDEGRRPSRVRQFDPDDRLTEPVCGQETPFNNLNI